MNISGLKIQIFITLFILMGIAIVLSNTVFLLFWQKSLIRLELKHVEAILDSNKLEGSQSEKVGGHDLTKKIGEICPSIGDNCISSLHYNGRKLYENQTPWLEKSILYLAKTSISSQQRLSELEGSAFNALFGGSRYLIVSDPIVTNDEKLGAVIVVVDLGSIYISLLKDQKILVVYLFFNLLILSIIGFFRMIHLILRPIDQIVEITDRYELANEVFFHEGNPSSEFGRLNRALNKMLMRIETDRKKLHETIQSLEDTNVELKQAHTDVVRAEKLASVGRLSAGLAHEIGNPISIVQGYIDLLKQDSLEDDDRNQFSIRAQYELDRVNRLLKELLDYSRTSTAGFKPVAVSMDLFNTVLDLAKLQKRGQNLNIKLDIEQNLHVLGNKDGLQQVVLNCVLNAMDAISLKNKTNGAGIILISAKRKVANDNAMKFVVEISIVDNGIGIGGVDRDKLFEPFFTTKAPGEGTGLGLFVSHSIIEAHSGSIALKDNKEIGAALIIELPLLENQ